MSARRLVSLLIAAAALGGGACRAPQGVLAVDVELPADQPVAQLVFALTAGATTRTSTLPEAPAGPLADSPQSAAFLLPPELIGVEVAVGVDGRLGDVVVARGEALVTPAAEVNTAVTVALVEVSRCGDGERDDGEACDDANDGDGDGCSAACAVEAGFVCDDATPTACAAVCGDGLVVASEACDDGNTADGDGCAAACTVEPGFACTGQPSTCAPICGDGVLLGAELCDDGNATAGDGCGSDCSPEPGFLCDASAPTSCTAVCGDGLVVASEACDDGDLDDGDGCAAACTSEPGFACTGQPSTCAPICGDAVLLGAELCDDGNATAGDGCGSDCSPEPGFVCDASTPTSCTAVCGDSLVVASEACDDGDRDDGDGCAAACTVEPGFACIGQPSTCAPVCGDALITGGEACDDGDVAGADGCSATCLIEAGFACDAAAPTTCTAVCGDGLLVAGEACDDDDTDGGDGCSAACAVEPGFVCAGQPSACAPVCGDGRVVLGEQCDDDDTDGGDGCSATCALESGFACSGQPSTCATVCGDGVVAGNEECDDGSGNGGGADQCRTTCTLPFCGDLVIDGGNGETCDDGNLDDTDACVTGCRAASCGDGIRQGTESCDDGNTTAGDGCTGCVVDGGFTCQSQPSFCRASGAVRLVGPARAPPLDNLVDAIGAAANGDALFLDAGATFNVAGDGGASNANKDLTIVGNTGTVVTFQANNGGGQNTLTIDGGRTVTLVGLTVRQQRNRSAIAVNGAGTTLVVRGCTIGPAAQFGIVAGSGTNVVVDRTIVRGNGSGGLDLAGQSFAIENSVLIENGGANSNVGGARLAFAGSATFRFNTVARNTASGAAGLVCDSPLPVASSIIATNVGVGQVSGGCTATTSTLVDPGFAADGFHLLPTAAALNVATNPCPTLDIDGQRRPMDGACDDGADERPADF